MDLSNFYIPANLNLTATNYSNVPFSTQGNDMAELTWENGRVSVNGLGPGLTSAAAAVGTLESIVNLATHKQQAPPGNIDYDDINVPCRSTQYQKQRSSPGGGGSSAAASVTDALVPCETTTNEVSQGIATCDVSGSARGKKPRPRRSPTGSDLGGSVSRHVPTVGKCEKDSCGFGVGTASFSSLASTRNTTSVDDHDDSAACLTRSQEDTCEKKKGIAASSSLLTKRSRAAAVHNQSERKRRETINEKMNILKKMIPDSSKTDKSSMLDEVIEYLKQLQAQVQMMMISRMSIPSMIMPFSMPQHPYHMPMIPPMGIAMNNMNMAHQNLANLTAPLINPNAPFTPVVMAPWNAATANQLSPSSVPISSGDPSSFLARSQPQSMSMEAYARMVAMMQQQQQQLDADKT